MTSHEWLTTDHTNYNHLNNLAALKQIPAENEKEMQELRPRPGEKGCPPTEI